MMINETHDGDLEDDPQDRHAPPGFEPCLQFFQGETKRQAIKEAMDSFNGELPAEDFAAAPGHFSCEEDDEGPPKFEPFGWMVFVRSSRLAKNDPRRCNDGRHDYRR